MQWIIFAWVRVSPAAGAIVKGPATRHSKSPPPNAFFIADEPTSALDNASRDALLTLLCELSEQAGSALLMVSHDRQVAGHFHRSMDFATLNQERDGAA